jgi:hypothetical protein
MFHRFPISNHQIQGEDISPKFSMIISLIISDYGNYGKFLAMLMFQEKSRKMLRGADVHYLSTSGLKKDYDWDSKQNEAKIGAFLIYEKRKV